jgi:hypothetical protein
MIFVIRSIVILNLPRTEEMTRLIQHLLLLGPYPHGKYLKNLLLASHCLYRSCQFGYNPHNEKTDMPILLKTILVF